MTNRLINVEILISGGVINMNRKGTYVIPYTEFVQKLMAAMLSVEAVSGVAVGLLPKNEPARRWTENKRPIDRPEPCAEADDFVKVSPVDAASLVGQSEGELLKITCSAAYDGEQIRDWILECKKRGDVDLIIADAQIHEFDIKAEEGELIAKVYLVAISEDVRKSSDAIGRAKTELLGISPNIANKLK